MGSWLCSFILACFFPTTVPNLKCKEICRSGFAYRNSRTGQAAGGWQQCIGSSDKEAEVVVEGLSASTASHAKALNTSSPLPEAHHSTSIIRGVCAVQFALVTAVRTKECWLLGESNSRRISR